MRIKFTTHFIHTICILCLILEAISGEPICNIEKETQLPEQTEDRAQALDHRPVAKSINGLISEWHEKPKLNPKPGDIIQYNQDDVALYLGKGAAHIFGNKYRNYDVLVHMMKDDLNDGIHIQLLNWAKEKNIVKARKYNILESKYESFSVFEMAQRAKKWIGCKVKTTNYEKNNYKHFAHLIKHGRLESMTENDFKKLFEDNDSETSEPASAPTGNKASESQTEKTKDQDTYYKMLELTSTADDAKIKKQYRKLALKYHPDKNGGKEEETFKAINDAHKILLNQEVRSGYDSCLSLAIENKSTVADCNQLAKNALGK